MKEFFALLLDTANPVADFYEGYVEKTVGIHMHHDLRDCMERDDNVTLAWDHAIHHLHKDKQKWNEDRKKAFEQSMPLLEGCASNGKWKIASAEIDAWWTGFFAGEQQEWEAKMIENFWRHPVLTMANMALIKIQWNFGYYRAAGKSLGRFDKFLMGHPQWDAFKAIDVTSTVQDKPYAGRGIEFTQFQAWAFDFTTGLNLKHDVMQCMQQDDIEYGIMDAAIAALNPYDDDKWRKYFEVTEALDRHNWAPCMSNKAIASAVEDYQKEWTAFWTQDGVDKIVKDNVAKHLKYLLADVEALQRNWDLGEYDSAGYYYARYWSYIMDKELPKPSPPQAFQKGIEQN